MPDKREEEKTRKSSTKKSPADVTSSINSATQFAGVVLLSQQAETFFARISAPGITEREGEAPQHPPSRPRAPKPRSLSRSGISKDKDQ
jgi:hypothetical protein